ncbi:MAG: toxin-antitoxin system YwqK family antitoxin [Ekhidna sp.]|nr:toxin-antitoxin system YwqK family antitoxin [Ekhidna sp.]
MKNLIWILTLLFTACGGPKSPISNDSGFEGSQIPANATVQDYEAIPGLQRAVVKSAEITVGEGDFLNGLHHGSWVTYEIDGKLKSVTTYFEGKKQGSELIFDNSGYVLSKKYYHQDVLNGESLKYKRRKIVERLNYSNGVQHGIQKKFYVDGTVMEESTYISGKIDGVARWYDQEGNLTIEYEYNMGELVSQ